MGLLQKPTQIKADMTQVVAARDGFVSKKLTGCNLVVTMSFYDIGDE
jgi:hypothetical protein